MISEGSARGVAAPEERCFMLLSHRLWVTLEPKLFPYTSSKPALVHDL